jgi:hypothetical protein
MKINLEKLAPPSEQTVTHSLRNHAADQSIWQNPITTWKYPTLEGGFKMLFQTSIFNKSGDRWWHRHYCWQIHLLTKLVLFAISVHYTLSVNTHVHIIIKRQPWQWPRSWNVGFLCIQMSSLWSVYFDASYMCRSWRDQNVSCHAVIPGFHLQGQQFYHKIWSLNLQHSKWKWMRTCRET